MKKIINIQTGETTTEELTAEEVARNETLATNRQAEETAYAQEATDKASGNQKLLDLGLTQAEVDAITK